MIHFGHHRSFSSVTRRSMKGSVAHAFPSHSKFKFICFYFGSKLDCDILQKMMLLTLMGSTDAHTPSRVPNNPTEHVQRSCFSSHSCCPSSVNARDPQDSLYGFAEGRLAT